MTRTDPYGCLAILWLVERRADFVGISASFENASGDVVAERATDLLAQMARDGMQVPPMFIGHDAPPAPEPSAHLSPPVSAPCRRLWKRGR